MYVDSVSVDVFVAYDPVDREFFDAFEIAITGLCAERSLVLQHYGGLLAGDHKSKADDRLKSSDLVLLFLSPEFLASSAWLTDIRPILSDRYGSSSAPVQVVPVLLRQCYWKDHPFGNTLLGNLNPLPGPDEFISKSPDHDLAWQRVVNGLRAVLASRSSDTRHLPSGTVTFLLTDVVQSTYLWNKFPESMGRVMERHDEIAEAVAEQFSGVNLKPRNEGDSLFLVFQEATDAVEAACAFQLAIGHERWPDGIILQVRTAIHTGKAEPVSNDYRGQPPNKCARIRALGHGSQILLSYETYNQVLDRLPADATCVALGRFRLRDFDTPESIYQLNHRDLPHRFPLLGGRYKLPGPQPVWTPFVGRVTDVETLESLLGTARLITITGPSGIGKTRLAAHVLQRLQTEPPVEVAFVELETQADAAQAIVTALEASPRGNVPLDVLLTEEIGDQQILLVLDQCEHLLPACKELIHHLLRHCPQLKVLVTSQVILGLDEERVCRLGPMSLDESVLLFEQLAEIQKPNLAVGPEDEEVARRICRRLDGIPLAIQLVAPWVNVLSLNQLEDSIGPQSQKMDALIARCCGMLSPQARTLLRRLSVFCGGFVLSSVEAICTGDKDLIRELYERSLLIVESSRSRDQRYRLLVPVREYMLNELRLSLEEQPLRKLHADHYLDWAERNERDLVSSVRADQAMFLEMMNLEHHNLLAALDWCEDKSKTEQQLRLVCVLSWFWQVRGYLTDGRQRLVNAITVNRQRDLNKLRTNKKLGKFIALALQGIGAMAFRQGDYPAALQAWELGLTLARSRKDRTLEARTLYNLGDIKRIDSDYPSAHTLVNESLTIFVKDDDRLGISEAQTRLGYLEYCQGHYGNARNWYEQALKNAQQQQHMRGVAAALTMLGNVAYRQADNPSDLTIAERYQHDGRLIYQQLGDTNGEAQTICGLGHIQRARGEYATAKDLYEKGLTLFRNVKDGQGEALALNGLGSTARSLGDVADAQRFHQESLAVCQRLQDTRGAGYAMLEMGRCASEQERYNTAHEWFSRAAIHFESIGDQRGYVCLLEGFAYLQWKSRHNPYIALVLYHSSQLLRMKIVYRRAWYNGLNTLAMDPSLSLDEAEHALTESQSLSTANALRLAMS